MFWTGPAWLADEFHGFLESIISTYQIDVVIPLMEGAVLALAKFQESTSLPAKYMVGSSDFALRLYDKEQTNKFCDSIGVKRISAGILGNQVFVKPKCGFGSRDSVLLSSKEEYASFFSTREVGDYLVQEYLPGSEFTLDCWVGDSEYYFSVRSRIEVFGGEVTKSITVSDTKLQEIAHQFLSKCDWFGPLTFQVMRYGGVDYLMEANGRLGGGVINSIEAGFDICKKIIFASLDRPLALSYSTGCLMMRVNREVFRWQ